nr:MAG TPA: hypothetical protein [Caudoviricetes sp.]
MGTKYNSVFGKIKLRKRYICCIFLTSFLAHVLKRNQ